MNIIEQIKNKAKTLNKTIILPEATDIRTLKAASLTPCRSFSYLLAELFSLFSPLNFLTDYSGSYHSNWFRNAAKP